MKLIKKITTCLAAVILCLNLYSFETKASGASVTIALSSGTVSIGSNVTVTVTVSGEDVSQYDIYLTYDSSVLQFNSGSGAASANGSGGTIRLVGGTGSTSLSFTAIANGTCWVSTSGTEVYNISYEQISINHAGANITVATDSGNSGNNGDNGNGNTDGENTDKTETTTEEDGRSANCNLSSLQVSPGTLEPAFSASTTAYFVQLEEDATSIVVSAETEDEKASTSVSGADSLTKGENIVKITVTAENGAVKIYNIRVAVGELLEDAKVTLDGKEYRIVSDATDLEVPERFSATTFSYKEWEVMAFESPNKRLILVCLEDENYDRAWYIYDSEQDTFLPYMEYSSTFNRYIILPVPEGTAVPEGYVKMKIDMQGMEAEAYQPADAEDKSIYLIYAMNIEGDEGFYLYDAVEGTFFRYVSEKKVIIEDATAEDATPADVQEDADNEGFFTRRVLMGGLLGTGVLLLIFVIATITLAVKKKKVDGELEQAEAMVSQLAATKDGVNHEMLSQLDRAENEKLTEKSDNAEQMQEPKQPEPAAEIPMVEITDTEPQVREGHIDIIKPKQEEKTAEKDEAEVKEAETIEVSSNPKERVFVFTKQDVYDEFEKQSAIIKHKIKENYDVNMDSAFADNTTENGASDKDL